MTEIFLNKKDGKVHVRTDNQDLHLFLEKQYKEYEYVGWTKKWGYVSKTVKIYDNRKPEQKDGTLLYKISKGWTSYVLNVLRNEITKEAFDRVALDVLYSSSYREAPFTNLRDYQNEDMLYMMKFKVGLCQVQTGYGKTSCIATLANYYHEVLGKRVLLVAPASKARDELVKRCKNVFNLDVSSRDKDINGHLDCIITSGLMNSSKAKDKDKKKDFLKILEGYEVLLADEVEYTINRGGEFIYDNCKGLECCYGFSGTADKQGGSTISFAKGLDEIVIRNRGLVKYFGPSLIYRLPVNRKVDFITIKSEALTNYSIPDLSNSKNLYSDIMNSIWTDDEVCREVVKIAKRFPMSFIPINNLLNILSCWIDKYFIGKFRVLLICGEGYIYYDLDGTKTKLDLDTVCEYAKNGKIDVIPSTSAGYRALDIPGLENILLIQGKVAGVVLQAVGKLKKHLPKKSSNSVRVNNLIKNELSKKV